MKPLPLAIFLIFLIAGIVYLPMKFLRPTVEGRYGPILHETHSEYSHIRIRERGTVRSLLFVDEKGAERCQSSVDLAAPAEVQLAYANGLFTSFLYRYPQDRVLIVGLGGGGMVRYLNHAFPGMTVESVEIDPVVVRLAAEYFGTVPGPRTRIHTADAFDFFEGERGIYDAIYLDAFLRDPEDSDQGEKTARLKTRGFLERLRSHLLPGGILAFNLIEDDPRTPEDFAAIRSVFPGATRFGVPGTGNLAVIAPTDVPIPSPQVLGERAAKLDRELSVGLPFRVLLGQRRD